MTFVQVLHLYGITFPLQRYCFFFNYAIVDSIFFAYKCDILHSGKDDFSIFDDYFCFFLRNSKKSSIFAAK